MKTTGKIYENSGVYQYTSSKGQAMRRCDVKVQFNDPYEYYDRNTGEKRTAYGRIGKACFHDEADEVAAMPVGTVVDLEIIIGFNARGFNEARVRTITAKQMPQQQPAQAQLATPMGKAPFAAQTQAQFPKAPQQAPAATNAPGVDKLPF